MLYDGGGSVTTRILSIASNTFREAVRDRVLYNLILFALLLVGAAVLFGQISLDIERIVVVNLSLTSISIFGVVMAIFIGIQLVSKEIERKTLYTVLARPVRRWEFIVGKFFGLVETLVVNALFMTAGFYAALFYVSHGFHRSDLYILAAIYFIILQFVMVTALALLFSSFSTPVFSAIFAFALFIVGTFADDLRNFARLSEGITRWVIGAVAYALPNFGSLNVILPVAHDQPVSWALVLHNSLYAMLYAGAAVCGAVLIFERRNLK
jgi:ABC-type transport system involved in multi-copper enzyme maturation permease subunit